MKALPFALLSLAPFAQSQSCSDPIVLPVLPGFDIGSAAGITCDGKTVVGTSIDFAYTEFGAYRWSEAQGLLALGTLGGADSAAFDVSCQGEVIVGYADTPTGESRPFRWTEAGGMQDLVALSGLTGPGVAIAASADGLAIAGTYFNGGSRAFLWTQATGLQELPELGAPGGNAYDVSDDGQVIVGAALNANFRARAVRWSAGGGILDLGTLGGPTSRAYAVSGDGQVIVGVSQDAAGIERAFHWTQSTGMVELDAVLTPNSNGGAVNRDGSVIGGGDPTGAGGAFLWTLDEGAQAPLLPNSLATSDMTPDGSTLLVVGSQPDAAGSLVLTSFILRTSPVGTKFCGAAVPNSTGCSGYISAVGSASVPADALTLSASNLPTGTFGFFLASQAMASPTAVPGSQGLLCLGGAIGRYVGPGQVQSSGAAGRFELSISLTALPTPMGMVAGVAGETWSFQCWHRDANPTATSNFTDALAIVLL